MNEFSTFANFEGQEASTLTQEMLDKAIESLRNHQLDPIITYQISHNCEDNKFREAMNVVENTPTGEQNVPTALLYGMNVKKAKYIPLGEIWLQTADGKVVKKFSIK